MALWTIVPVETLLPGENAEPRERREIIYHGVPVMIENIAENQYRIIRILSTDPRDFLMDQIQPGSLLSL